jgi:hypothetical protein
VSTDFTLAEAHTEMLRLSRLVDAGVEASKQHAVDLAAAEATYRKAKAEAWVRCPIDDPSVPRGEREWTAARREAWVNAETADLRQARDLQEAMKDAAREAVRARQTQLSAWQTLVRAHQAEAEFVRTTPTWAAA